MTTETVTATVIDGENGNPGAVVVELPPEEPPSSDAVEIAQIQADAAVEIASTHAAVEITAIEARAETDAETAALRERITWLEAETASLTEQNRQLTEQLTPLPLPEEVIVTEEITEPISAINPETVTDTSETNSETSSETRTEAQDENADVELAEEVAAPPIAMVRRKVRFL